MDRWSKKVSRFLALGMTRLIPETRGFGVKRTLFRVAGISVANGVQLSSSIRVLCHGKISIGESSWIGPELLLVGGVAEILIGSNCDIAPRTIIATGTHKINLVGKRIAGEGSSNPVSIGNGCWIGASVTILGGTTLGNNCIVAAGAVVRGDFPDHALIGGVPAKVIRKII